MIIDEEKEAHLLAARAAYQAAKRADERSVYVRECETEHHVSAPVLGLVIAAFSGAIMGALGALAAMAFWVSR